MPHYYLNRNHQNSGEHEVHKSGCSHDPWYGNRIDLGWCSDDYEALSKAKRMVTRVDGCFWCCRDIHHG